MPTARETLVANTTRPAGAGVEPASHYRRLVVAGLCGLGLAFGLELLSRALVRGTALPRVVPESISLLAFLVLTAPALRLVLRVVERRSIRVLAILAAVFLPLSQVLNTLDKIPALDGVPVVGDGGVLHRATESVLFLGGLGLLLAVFYLSLVEILLAKQRVSLESASLRREIGERRRAEAALRGSEARVRALNESLEERVSSRTRQLEESNRELEAFSYSVSHDLRAPLQVIQSCVEVIRCRQRGDLAIGGGDELERISENTLHMAQLIDDLLALSKAGRDALRVSDVSPEGLVHGIIETLRRGLEGRRVEFRVGSLPPCRADERLLGQVFQNLLENALKFSRTREHARIEVGYLDDGRGVYFVRDNGLGFDPEGAGKLFEPFQRLHSAEECPGTGLGLAVVARIVRRHGGKVWARGEVGTGATFYFEMPVPTGARSVQ